MAGCSIWVCLRHELLNMQQDSVFKERIMSSIRAPFKIHGGKYYLKKWIIGNFPNDYTQYDYMEPFSGAGNVLLNKNPCEEPLREMINDIDPGVVAILRTLRDEPELLIKKLKPIEYNEKTFIKALKKKEFGNDLEYAVNEFILRRMSRGGLKKAFAWSDRERGGQPGDVNAWKTSIDLLPKIAQRLKNVFIFNKSAIGLIKAFNYPKIILYCDPPYVPDSRVSPEAYEYEMSTDDHISLSEELNNFTGKVVLSGYPSTLYRRLYKNWRCIKKKIVNHSSQKSVKDIKVECIWVNF